MNCVEVDAPSHVHVGNFDLSGELGRLFGTVGIVLAQPRLRVRVCIADYDKVEGAYSELAQTFLDKIRHVLNTKVRLQVEVLEAFPRGVGLGLTTALALSLGVAVCKLVRREIPVPELALRLGRGLVSALGTYGFMYGGFIVDGGFPVGKLGHRIPPLIFRADLPENWIFVVAIPRRVPDRIREIKQREAEILSSLPKMKSELADRLCRLVLVGLIPAVLERDIELFGRALTEFNKLAGTYWSLFQEGRAYCCPEVEEGIEMMLRHGAKGAAQSCWGPVFYGVVDRADIADRIRDVLTSRLNVDVVITSARNVGALIRTL